MVSFSRLRYPLMIAAGLVVVLLMQSCQSSSDQSQTAHNHQTDHLATTSPSSIPPSSTPPTELANQYSGQIPSFDPRPKAERVPIPASSPLAPLFKTIPTQQHVAFITIDDGNVRLPEMFELLKAAKVPFSAFLISSVAAKDPAFFQKLQQGGTPIEDHTITHANLRGLAYEQQKHEICGSADQLKSLFGKRPTLFRPPGGNYDQITLRAAHDCGMKAVLYWSESVKNGQIGYQTPGKKMHPGDIILMHFRKEFIADFITALNAIKAQNLTPALLEDYIG